MIIKVNGETGDDLLHDHQGRLAAAGCGRAASGRPRGAAST